MADAWLSNDEPKERMSAGEDAKEYAESGSTTQCTGSTFIR
ncbi:MAG: hypothetical protein ACLU9T_16060 [Blautia faecis]